MAIMNSNFFAAGTAAHTWIHPLCFCSFLNIPLHARITERKEIIKKLVLRILFRESIYIKINFKSPLYFQQNEVDKTNGFPLNQAGSPVALDCVSPYSHKSK
jgi:hypothetical protein